jgi:hypothetical protein
MPVKDNICSKRTNPNVPFKGTIEQVGSSFSRKNLQTVSQSFIFRIWNVTSEAEHIELTLRWDSITKYRQNTVKHNFLMFILLRCSYIIYLTNYKLWIMYDHLSNITLNKLCLTVILPIFCDPIQHNGDVSAESWDSSVYAHFKPKDW